MKNDSFVAALVKDDKSPDRAAEDLLKTIQKALLCLDEGNTGRAAQLLYQALSPDLLPAK